jgi:hypothetical protein
MQALFMNLVPPNSHFFFNSGSKKTPFLSLDVKCDQQTHKNRCLQLWHQCQENYRTKSHNNSANVLAGEFPHKIEADLLLGSRGFLWVWIMGSQNVMGSGYGSNISESLSIRYTILVRDFCPKK